MKTYIQLQTPLLGIEVYNYMKDKFPSRFNNSNYNNVIKEGSYCPSISTNYNLTKKEIYEYMNSIFNASIFHKWKKGDVWIINNIKYAHARMNIYEKDNREIIASLGNFIDIR